MSEKVKIIPFLINKKGVLWPYNVAKNWENNKDSLLRDGWRLATEEEARKEYEPLEEKQARENQVPTTNDSTESKTLTKKVRQKKKQLAMSIEVKELPLEDANEINETKEQ